MNRCVAVTTKKLRCKLNATHGSQFCHRHQQMHNAGRNVQIFQDDPVQNVHALVPNPNNRPVAGINNQERRHNDKPGDKKAIKDSPEIEHYEPLVLGETNECQCCFEKFSPKEIITCSGANSKYKHMVCSSCLTGYMETVLDQKKSVGCMMSSEGCHGRYSDCDVMTSLSEDKYAKYAECTEVEEAVTLSKILDNYYLCPFCSKYGLIIDNIEQLPKENLAINCPKCTKAWCVKCRNLSHTPDPCGKLKTTNTDTIKRAIENVIDESAIHKCPKCFTKFTKEDGCNLMTCTSCHSYSCYVCGILIVPKGDVKYWHFKGSGSADANAECMLYNNGKGGTQEEITKSNQEFNNKKIISALENLVTINLDNIEIATIICNEIKAKGYEIKKFDKVEEATRGKATLSHYVDEIFGQMLKHQATQPTSLQTGSNQFVPGQAHDNVQAQAPVLAPALAHDQVAAPVQVAGQPMYQPIPQRPLHPRYVVPAHPTQFAYQQYPGTVRPTQRVVATGNAKVKKDDGCTIM